MSDTDVAPSLALPVSPAADRGRAWVVTALLVVFMMINFADKAVLGLAADPIRADLHLSATSYGLANSAFFLFFSLSGAAVGILADRVPSRGLLLGMALLWSLAQGPLALGGGIAVLVGSRVLLGAAEGPAYPIAQHTALSWFADRRRSLAASLVLAGTSLGVVVASPVVTSIMNRHGWRAAFGTVAVAGALWAVLWLLLGRENPAADRPVTPDTASDTRPPRYRDIIRTRTWVGVTLAYFATYWVVAFALVWMPSYLENALGYSSTSASKLVGLAWALSIVVIFGQAGMTGWLLRRGVASRVARGRVGGVLLLVAAAAMLAVPAASHGAAVALLIAGTVFAGPMSSIAAATAVELVPAVRRGGALGTMNAAATLAGLIGPAVIGKLIDAHAMAGYRDAAVLSGALLLIGAIAALWLIDAERDAANLAPAKEGS
ncbi:MFS transporter [Actinospica durhamensis]|uniref:MFS transporter n=1 Tax=Actinospica durhamensis TaxID=1508375 RepID=A0A941IQZ8_9ACTN|nr:MFS transporter [Actinospica durhamensis]MBR7833428.1 MFS transporter [Actinospica durhamensis]